MDVGNVDTFKSKIEWFNNRGGFKIVMTESRREGFNLILEKFKNYMSFAFELSLLVGLIFAIRKVVKASNINAVGASPVNAKAFRPQVNLETRFKDVAGLADAKLEIT